PRRSSNVAIISALGLAFGVFSLAILASQQAYQREVVRASVGADAVVFAASDDSTFGENLTRIPGVVGASQVLDLPASPLFCCAQVFALEPETFFDIADPEPWYFEGLALDEAKELLAAEGTVLISKAYHESAFVYVGDKITVETREVFLPGNGEPDPPVRVNVTVGGVIRGLPGLPSTEGLTQGNAIYGSVATFSHLLEGLTGITIARHYLALEASADWEGVRSVALEQGAFDVRVYEEELERMFADPFQQAVLGFMRMQILFIVAVLTAGLGLVIYASSLERDTEFASISARGSSGWQMAGLLTGEALSIMIIAIAIGSSVGFLAAYLTTETLILGPTGVPIERLVPFSLVLPVEALLLVALTPLAMIIVTLLVSWRVARLNIGKVLKLRGG
ncbi:MAG: ABC transporter permease, partial [Dehalococcoidia bacterium]